ncbi:MAG TPA: gliding motility-associated protein GldE [Candidatus Gallibacteroides avistercoris]|uniref:Gliding motility-associated protein GldE n=1 Tax=Candidatus Gallibacteroides avistercoris TaxID=2840833 RepID=A0A9D1SDI1_9BACT|nr:gliding motility-associated protein GldE [Candidatus Gallibacteroides avistercoris]
MDTDYFPSLFHSIESYPLTSGAIVALSLACILLGFSYFISCLEIAFLSLTTQSHDKTEAEERASDTIIQALQDKSDYLLASILICHNFIYVAVIILCNYTISTVLSFTQVPIAGIFLQTIALSFLLLLFGEIIPKVYVCRNPSHVIQRNAAILNLLIRICYPLSKILVKTSQTVNKEIMRHQTSNISMDELSEALAITEVTESDEKKMLQGIIKFGEKTVEKIMTSRIDIAAIDIHLNFKELIQRIIETGYSRIPVFEDSRDSIKGIIYVKDLLAHIDEKEDFKWQTLLRPAYFVPETKRIDDLLEEFRSKKIHMAIVVDEFGGTSGIVTLEDILEEIVGEISDEYDEEERQFVRIDKNTYIFEGKTLLNDFYKITGTDEAEFEKVSGEAETLAGLILELKENFPVAKEKIIFNRFTFTILEIDKRRIIKVKVSIHPKTD